MPTADFSSQGTALEEAPDFSSQGESIESPTLTKGQRLRAELASVRESPASVTAPEIGGDITRPEFAGVPEYQLAYHTPIQIPRLGLPTPPKIGGVAPDITNPEFAGNPEYQLAYHKPYEVVVPANVGIAGAEAMMQPSTPAIIGGATVAPQVVLPTLTAQMAKSGSTKLAEGIEDIRSGREDEGVRKISDATAELGFAAAPALHPRAFMSRSIEALNEESPPTPGETAAPTSTPVQPTGGPENATVSERPATEILQTVRDQPIEGTKAVSSETSPSGVLPSVKTEETTRRTEVPLTPEEQAAARAQPASIAPYENKGVGSPADEFGAIYGPTLTPEMRTRFDDQVGESFELPSEPGTTTTLKVKPHMLWVETNRRLPGPVNEYETGVAYMHIRANGETVLDASKHGRPIDKQAADALMNFLGKTQGERQAKATPPAQLPAARAEEAPASTAPAAPIPPASAQAKAQAEVSRVAATEGKRSAETIKKDLVSELTKAWAEAPDEADPSKPTVIISIPGDGEFTLNNTSSAIETVLKKAKRIQTSAEAKALFPKGAVESSSKAIYRGAKEAPEKPKSETTEPERTITETPEYTGPTLTLLGLTDDKFSLPSLRKLSKDTIRRLANSLGVEATVPAIARKAKERFDEMRKQPPGPIGMGGALASEMSGEESPKAGTPAHAVETGPPSERPLGLTDPTSAPFVSLSLEMLGQKSSVPPEYSVDTSLKSLAGASAPRLTAMNRKAGEALVRYAASKIAAPYKAIVFASRVLDTGVNPIKFGAALVEDNLRSIEQELLRQSNEALQKGDQSTADAFYERALNVKSLIGGKNSPFKTEQEYQDFMADPVTKEAVKRHIQYWQEDIDPQYKMAQGIDPTVELPTRGQQTGARINLKAIIEGDERGTRPVTASRGGLTSSFKRKSPFARTAKGTGDIYESNYPDIIANTYNRQLEIANQNHLNALLVDEGLARIDKPGARVMFGDKPGIAFPLSRRLILTSGESIPAGQNIYVRPEFAREYRTALNVDAPAHIPFFTEFSNLFTKAALWGFTDASVHVSNLGTALFTRPNSPILWDTLAKATGRADVPITIVRALIKSAADNRAQLADLAEIGAMREPFKGTGILNPVIKWADRTTRLVLDDAYQGLAKQGLVENTETARREFINQVGQYNKRLQGQFTVWLRDTGVGPFVTAGKTFNALGIRNMLLSPGLKAVSPKAAVALRANALSGWIGFATLAALINCLVSRNKGGGVMGRPGVPIGNVDLGTEDKQGHPLSLPLGDILGYTRGLRATGARRQIESVRYGIDKNQALDNALGDSVNAAVSPALGPLVRSGFAAATGRPPALNVARTSPVVGPHQSQFAANVMDALRKANPVVNAAFDLREGKTAFETARGQAPRFTPQAGMTESRAEALPKIINRARLNEYIDDLSRRTRRLPRGERLGFIRDEINKSDLSGAERLNVFRKVQTTLKYQ